MGKINIIHFKDAAIAMLIALFAVAAFAGGDGAPPWEAPLLAIVASISGPVSAAIGTVAVIGCGLGMAFSEGGTMTRKILSVGLGLAISFSAASWALAFFGFGGTATGALI